MAVNINRDVDDPFYRYTMPKLVAKVEGSGNGIKTVIVNMEDISKSLSRPPSYPTKYFGCELGAQVQMDEKNSRYIVNGAHDGEKLSQLLDGFIKKFVSCPKCRNPETTMRIKSNQDVTLQCKACGAENLVDMRHKLISFILKNPPAGAAGSNSPSTKKRTKDERRREKQEKSRKPPKAGGDDEDEGDDEDVTPPSPALGVSGSKASSRKTSSNDAATAVDEKPSKSPSVGSDNVIDEAAAVPVVVNDDEAFSVDTSEAASAERRRQILESDMLKNLVLSGGGGGAANGKDAYDELADLLSNENSSTHDMIRDIVGFTRKANLNDEKVAAVAIQVLFAADIIEKVPARLGLLSKLIVSEKGQKGVLGGLERLVGLTHPELQKKLPRILKLFYDKDILQEEVILQWAATPSKKYVDLDLAKQLRKNADAFVTWLRTAEEESDSE